MKTIIPILLISTALFISGCSHRCQTHTCSMRQAKATCSQKTPAHFAFDSAVLDQVDKDNLERVAHWLKENPTQKVRISGYTDSTGPKGYNLWLSKKRAKSAASYLESLGIAADRISTHGFGASDFTTSNDTPADRAKNRRIEISFYQ